MRIEFEKLAKSIDYEKTLSDIEDFRCLEKEAKEFLEFHDWCTATLDSYIGIYYAGIVAVFLFEIESDRPDVDEWLWVITGDLPPAYITCEDSPNAACALDAYIGAMSEWVVAARAGESIAGLVPVNVPDTRENADSLQRRLDMLDDRVLSLYREDLQN